MSLINEKDWSEVNIENTNERNWVPFSSSHFQYAIMAFLIGNFDIVTESCVVFFFWYRENKHWQFLNGVRSLLDLINFLLYAWNKNNYGIVDIQTFTKYVMNKKRQQSAPCRSPSFNHQIISRIVISNKPIHVWWVMTTPVRVTE